MTASDAACPQQSLLPDTYSGDGDFDSWEKHFSACAAANSWSDERKLLVLPARLRGRAQRIYDHLTATDKETYSSLRAALSAKCSPSALRILAAANFRSRIHQGQEALDTFGYDLFDLYDKAYPGSSADMRDTMVRDQFVLGLERGTRDKVTSANPATFSDALQAAARVVALRLLPGALSTAATTSLPPTPSSASLEALASAVTALTQKVDTLCATRPPLSPWQDTTYSSACYHCGVHGHFARACPRRPWRQPIQRRGGTSFRFPRPSEN